MLLVGNRIFAEPELFNRLLFDEKFLRCVSDHIFAMTRSSVASILKD